MDKKKEYIRPELFEIGNDKSIAIMYRSPQHDEAEDDWLGNNGNSKLPTQNGNGAFVGNKRIANDEALSKPLTSDSPF